MVDVLEYTVAGHVDGCYLRYVEVLVVDLYQRFGSIVFIQVSLSFSQ